MPTPNSSPTPAPSPIPSPSPAPAAAPSPAPSFDQFAPPPVSGTPQPAFTPATSSGGGGSGGNKTGLIIGIVVAVIAAGAAAFFVLGGKDDKKSDTASVNTNVPMTISEDSGDDDSSSNDSDDTMPSDEPSTEGGYAVGEIADVTGGVTRVNAVETETTPRAQSNFLEEGYTITRVEVETCAEDDAVNAGWTQWYGYLDDGSEAESYLSDEPAAVMNLVPGDCARGFLSFAIPDGSKLGTVQFTDFWADTNPTWDLTRDFVTVDGPIAHKSPEGLPIGSTFTFSDGTTATLEDAGNFESTDDYYELPAGFKLIAANVEVCAGSQQISVYPSDFNVMTDDNFLGANEFFNSTFQSSDLSPGDCAKGGIVFAIPESSKPVTLLYTAFLLSETARWSAE